MPACLQLQALGKVDVHRLDLAIFWAPGIALTHGEPQGLNHTTFQQNNSFVRGVLHFFSGFMRVKSCRKALVQLLNYILVWFSYMPAYDPSWAGWCAPSRISGV